MDPVVAHYVLRNLASRVVREVSLKIYGALFHIFRYRDLWCFWVLADKSLHIIDQWQTLHNAAMFTLCYLHNVPLNHAFPGHQPVDWLRPVLVSFLKEDKTKKRIEKEKRKTLFFSGSSPVALPRSWEWVEWPWLDTENIENIGDGVDYEEDEDSDDDDDNDGDGDDDDALDDDGLDYVNYDNIDKYDADADDNVIDMMM